MKVLPLAPVAFLVLTACLPVKKNSAPAELRDDEPILSGAISAEVYQKFNAITQVYDGLTKPKIDNLYSYAYHNPVANRCLGCG